MSQQQQSQQNQQNQQSNQQTNTSSFDAFSVGSGYNFSGNSGNMGSSASHAQRPNLQPVTQPVTQPQLNPAQDQVDDDLMSESSEDMRTLSTELLHLVEIARKDNIEFTSLHDLVLQTAFEKPIISKEKGQQLQQVLNPIIASNNSVLFANNRSNELTNDKLRNDYNFVVTVGKMVERMFKVNSAEEMSNIMTFLINAAIFRKTLYDVGLATGSLDKIASVESTMTCSANPYTNDVMKVLKKEKKKDTETLVMQSIKSRNQYRHSMYTTKRSRDPPSYNKTYDSQNRKGGKRYDYNFNNNNKSGGESTSSSK